MVRANQYIPKGKHVYSCTQNCAWGSIAIVDEVFFFLFFLQHAPFWRSERSFDGRPKNIRDRWIDSAACLLCMWAVTKMYYVRRKSRYLCQHPHFFDKRPWLPAWEAEHTQKYAVKHDLADFICNADGIETVLWSSFCCQEEGALTQRGVCLMNHTAIAWGLSRRVNFFRVQHSWKICASCSL